MLPLRVWVDLGAMAMKEYSAFPKVPHYWSLTTRLFSVISRTLLRGSYPNVEMQSVYSTAQADKVTGHSLGESYPSAEMQSVYSIGQAD